jgi:hypothetical protein
MLDPSLPLHAAIVAQLRATESLVDLVGGSIFDAPPQNAARPYVSLGEPQVVPDKADCVDGARTAYPIHGWADGPDSVLIKQIGAALLAAIDEAALIVEGHRVISCEFEQVQYLNDPDPLTRHVVVIPNILTEPA